MLGQACTIVSYIHPLPDSGNPDAGGAPSAGVVTKVRLRAKVVEHPTQVTFLLADLTPEPSGSATASIAAIGPTVTLQPTEDAEEATGETPIGEFDVRMPVRKGQQLAVQGTEFEATYNASGDKFSYVFMSPLQASQIPQPSLEATGELLVQGVIEPDADGDGFGDETQDRCPAQRTTQGACDTTAPTVSGLRVHAGHILYTLSEAATVNLSLAMRRGHVFRSLGKAFAGPGNAGPNRRALPRARKLAKGTYRLTLVDSDGLGNRAAYTARFQIKR